MQRIRRYIAYGSNLNLEQMKHRCPTAKVLGPAVMHGWALRFRGVATIERCKRAAVPVLVWDIQPQDELALDCYEGWPRLYRKEQVRLYLNGKQVSAFVYIMNEEKHRYSPPSPMYYDVIREGYESAGFDVSILKNAAMGRGTAAGKISLRLSGGGERPAHDPEKEASDSPVEGEKN